MLMFHLYWCPLTCQELILDVLQHFWDSVSSSKNSNKVSVTKYLGETRVNQNIQGKRYIENWNGNGVRAGEEGPQVVMQFWHLGKERRKEGGVGGPSYRRIALTKSCLGWGEPQSKDFLLEKSHSGPEMSTRAALTYATVSCELAERVWLHYEFSNGSCSRGSDESLPAY